MYQQDSLSYIDNVIKKYVPESQFPEIIYESMNYCLFGGGKRVRPLLMLLTCKMADGELNFIEPLLSAVEMIHTYSLIHDDLPCMDDDDYRRGRLSCHKKFGETVAVLTGDALLNLAYETVIRGFNDNVNIKNYTEAANIFSTAAGVNGMIGGQVADSTETTGISKDELLNYIHTNKTGALIRASVMCGGLSAELNENKLNALDTFGKSLGMIFQITDDILDSEDMSESEKNKLTYPSYYGLQYSKDKVAELTEICLKSLSVFGDKSEALCEFTKQLSIRVK